jgi:hypothetical protein
LLCISVDGFEGVTITSSSDSDEVLASSVLVLAAVVSSSSSSDELAATGVAGFSIGAAGGPAEKNFMIDIFIRRLTYLLVVVVYLMIQKYLNDEND